MTMKRAGTFMVVLVVLGALSVVPSGRAENIVATTGADTFAGTNNNDRLDALAGDDIVFGRKGSDRVDGGDGNDRLFLGAGRDKGVGGSGNDEIIDDDGASDVIRAGVGNDLVVSADGGADRIDCGPGNDTAFIDSGDVTKGCERRFRADNFREALFFGSNRADGFVTDDDDRRRRFEEDETLFLKSGDDQAVLGDGDDTIYLGRGRDRTLSGDDDRDGKDVIIDDDGKPGDVIGTGADDDIVYSVDGAADTINCGGDSNDREDTVFVDRVDTTLGCEHIFAA